VTVPQGYEPEDLVQHRLNVPVNARDIDPRTAFMHDRDRILYSSAFAALAGKTQVVASGEAGSFHTRLTHSLKVEQLGRRITEMLSHRLGDGQPGPDPDLVSAACLAHDIGHPPFGHAGEEALARTYSELDPKRRHPQVNDERSTTRSDGTATSSETESGDGNEPPRGYPDGFEGNAQNLRILTYLSARKTQAHRGLHLTRAALDATTKYPWERADPEADKKHARKFGIYREDKQVADWIFPNDVPAPREGDTEPPRPIEEQIMDWADNVTYACHDVEDFFRAGVIPLEVIFAFEIDKWQKRVPVESPELDRFLTYVEKSWTRKGKSFDRVRAIKALAGLGELLKIDDSYGGTYNDKQLVTSMTSQLIVHFLEGLKLRPTGLPTVPMVRYNAALHIPPDRKFLCDLLKELIWFYVINSPQLASQQHGQRLIIRDLLTWHYQDPERLLPRDRSEELADHGNSLRAACDHVASLTERQAISLHWRMAGTKPGAITDRLS
jgi:dGTPase